MKTKSIHPAFPVYLPTVELSDGIVEPEVLLMEPETKKRKSQAMFSFGGDITWTLLR